MPTPKKCEECRRLVNLYFRLVGRHSDLLEKQRQKPDAKRAAMEMSIVAAQVEAQEVRRRFAEHRATHDAGQDAHGMHVSG
jgi:hypothetical protein